jgi:hypothetical protein
MKRFVLAGFCLLLAHGSAHAARRRAPKAPPTRHEAGEVVTIVRGHETTRIAVPRGKTLTLRVEPEHDWYWGSGWRLDALTRRMEHDAALDAEIKRSRHNPVLLQLVGLYGPSGY